MTSAGRDTDEMDRRVFEPRPLQRTLICRWRQDWGHELASHDLTRSRDDRTFRGVLGLTRHSRNRAQRFRSPFRTVLRLCPRLVMT